MGGANPDRTGGQLEVQASKGSALTVPYTHEMASQCLMYTTSCVLWITCWSAPSRPTFPPGTVHECQGRDVANHCMSIAAAKQSSRTVWGLSGYHSYPAIPFVLSVQVHPYSFNKSFSVFFANHQSASLITNRHKTVCS